MPRRSPLHPPVLGLPGLPEQAPPPGFVLGAGVEDDADVYALPLLAAADDDGSPTLGPGADAAFAALGLDPWSLRIVERATGRAGEVVAVPVPAVASEGTRPGLPTGVTDLLLVGVGDGSTRDVRRAGAALAKRCRDRDGVATTLGALDDDGALEALVVGMTLGSFGLHVRGGGPSSVPVERVSLLGVPDDEDHRERLARAAARAGASWTARALATVPSNVKDPTWMVGRAEEAAATADRLTLTAWDRADLEREGFGGVLGVGRASASEPRFVRLDYAPRRAARRAPRVVLVGKGITFDTGGLSLKPAEGMVTMKRDMTGGGVVIAVLSALAALDCPVRVTGLVPLAENAVSGDALRPGDVIRHRGGRTTEVTNTDAEGRLVMADALAYAVEELAPAALVDVATLTGAAKVALGQRTGGLFADDDGLAETLLASGTRVGEPLWRLPLTADYEAKLASPVADADNAPGGPGATTAALFLRHFTGDVPWAHLDIASVGDSPSDWHEWTAGPSGFGVRLLLDWLTSADPLAGIGD
ncbi:M17 family metallopeptidase [Nocardioides sp. CFH 31398]|uniref:leucyl aminopeptidase family protein n=1 Tax=Nocardioides sp. CFH 31398 TaxID=2919579 RepID=UPI001F0510CC|nr:leucyl aminopeptidase family protein [Nocardioides sp. CFH 31398]MCH1868014.1 leucyl aminopeptidase family protein [Nocardioides sp. CFH 31398]